MKFPGFRFLALSLVLIMASGCASTTTAKDFNGLASPDGTPIAHLNTSHIALHILGSRPLAGDATLETTVSDFTANAKNLGASKVRIDGSNTLKLWFIFPPVSIFITPVISSVNGEAIQ